MASTTTNNNHDDDHDDDDAVDIEETMEVVVLCRVKRRRKNLTSAQPETRCIAMFSDESALNMLHDRDFLDQSKQDGDYVVASHGTSRPPPQLQNRRNLVPTISSAYPWSTPVELAQEQSWDHLSPNHSSRSAGA